MIILAALALQTTALCDPSQRGLVGYGPTVSAPDDATVEDLVRQSASQ
jgi:hypothetical protein